MPDAVCRRLLIRGRVQGVGYRAAARDAAVAHELSGWVRNRADGSVEALVCGAPDAVAGFVDWAHRGPPAARVDAVFVEPAEPPTAGGFELRPTA